MAQRIDAIQQAMHGGAVSTSPGTSYPSDEEILGITTGSEGAASSAPTTSDAEGEGAASLDHARDNSGAPTTSEAAGDVEAQPATAGAPTPDGGAIRGAVPEWLKPLLADPRAGKELQALWEASQAYREIFPTVADARALKELFPGGAEDGKQLVARAQEFDRVDAAYFSGDPAAQAQLAQHLLEDNPRAFLGMLREAAQTLAARDPQTFDKLVEQVAQVPPRGIATGASNRSGESSLPTEARQEVERQREQVARERVAFERERNEFRAAQFSSFQQATNDAAVSQVRQSIEQVIASVLPAGVSEGARKRIAEDVFHEVNVTLQNDAALTRQVAGILRQWRFDDPTKQQVVNLIFGRAKALVPTAAKRIVSDWTSSVLTANRDKAAKQQAATSRVDIVGGGAPETAAKKPLSPRDIDYSKTTDDQILSL